MQRKIMLCLVLFLALTSQKCGVHSGGAPSDTMGAIAANRHNAEHQPQQHSPHIQSAHHQSGLIGSSGSSGSSVPTQIAASPSHALYHPTPGSGHMEPRNSYNLLSEAMSQAVSNEFSSMGSGSADGACHAEDLDCYSGNVQDRLGMEAIRSLHRQLDDDDNGNIDLSESDDFLREELKYDSGYEKRQKAFHFNDDMHISVKELWEAWLRSEVHNWTAEQTTDWLAQSVQLPQYVELFRSHKVTGATLPRLAVNNMHYVSNVLGIKDPIHKQKIALKAMDVVLFGPPRETGTRWKDYILVTLLLSAIIGCWYAYQQNKNAKRHLRRMAQDMEGLQRAEQSLQEMQKELERARMEQENVATEKMDLERRLKEAPVLSSSNSDLEVQKLKKEIEILRSELSRAEIELVDNCWTPPPQLQSWLQYTYELESKNHLKKRIAAEKQLQSAREACEKLRKKRSSLVGAFVSTHGKSIDEVDRSIVEARNSLGEVTNELQERLHRWKQIETCLGFNIVNNNGISYLESVLYSRNGGSSNKGSRGRITSSNDDLDDESVQDLLYIYPGMLDSYSRSSGLGGGSSGLLNSSSNTICDDSSCSEDGGDTPHPVQFMLGGAPTPSLKNARTIPHTPLDTALNHMGNASVPVSTVMASSISMPAGAVSSSASASISPTSGTSSPPPLSTPMHNNAHSNFYLTNDSQLLRSQSTDLVPMEVYSFISRQQQQQQQQSQQQQQQSQPQSQSQLGAFAKSGIVSSGQQFLGSGTGGGGSSSGSNKKMVKQLSTASQQSSSSTSSSVQSAPSGPSASSEIVGGSGKGYSPGRWPSHERIMPFHQQQQQQPQQHEHQLLARQPLQQQYHQQHHQPHGQHQQQRNGDQEPLLQPHYATTTTKPPSAATAATISQHQSMSGSLSLQSLCGKPQYGSSASPTTATSASTVASSHSDTQMEDQLLLATDTGSLDGANTLKKRKRRLRFPFGGGHRKSGSNASGSGSSTSTNASKLT